MCWGFGRHKPTHPLAASEPLLIHSQFTPAPLQLLFHQPSAAVTSFVYVSDHPSLLLTPALLILMKISRGWGARGGVDVEGYNVRCRLECRPITVCVCVRVRRIKGSFWSLEGLTGTTGRCAVELRLLQKHFCFYVIQMHTQYSNQILWQWASLNTKHISNSNAIEYDQILTL